MTDELPPDATRTTEVPVKPGLGDSKASTLPAMPLALGAEGQDVTLAEVHGGRRFLHRLAEMGLTPGVRFRILKKGRPGPFIIALRETRLMLGHGMIRRIFVRPV